MKKTLAAIAMAFSGNVMGQQPLPPSFAEPNLGQAGAQRLAANCAACHGTSGRPASGSSVAGLAGRPRDELVQAMAQFKSGQRPATVMHQIAKGYTDAEIAVIAEHFSRLSR